MFQQVLADCVKNWHFFSQICWKTCEYSEFDTFKAKNLLRINSELKNSSLWLIIIGFRFIISKWRHLGGFLNGNFSPNASFHFGSSFSWCIVSALLSENFTNFLLEFCWKSVKKQVFFRKKSDFSLYWYCNGPATNSNFFVLGPEKLREPGSKFVAPPRISRQWGAPGGLRMSSRVAKGCSAWALPRGFDSRLQLFFFASFKLHFVSIFHAPDHFFIDFLHLQLD